MEPLDKTLRNRLERAIKDARDIAEAAGVLRDKPNIKWNKDRGKDVESTPWFHKFKGDQINDYNLTLAKKHAARKVAG